jgi:hypothetical protein
VVQYAAAHTVEDANGARFQLYEFRGSRFFMRVRQFELDTGEPVRRVDFDNYVITTTGEKLVRVGT